MVYLAYLCNILIIVKQKGNMCFVICKRTKHIPSLYNVQERGRDRRGKREGDCRLPPLCGATAFSGQLSTYPINQIKTCSFICTFVHRDLNRFLMCHSERSVALPTQAIVVNGKFSGVFGTEGRHTKKL